jgi:tRNA nucleotidyltransferase/poly(A) polymerase
MKLDTVLRVAGGWVRDKVLKKLIFLVDGEIIK